MVCSYLCHMNSARISSAFKNHSRSLAIAAMAALMITSCTKPESKLAKYGPEVEAVMRTDSGAFRGVNLGDKLDSVQKREAVAATEADSGYLYYEFKLDSNSYNVSYNFDENGLNEIRSDVYVKNPANTDRIFNAFKKYFDDHFGPSETHGGYTVWSVRSEKFGDVKINLSDESLDLTVPNSPGKLSIWIYPNEE
ncbi:MAG: hypothetical protein ACJ77K_12670 [Bacteroidia bacterium]